jgi:calcyclin binding protein
LSLWFAVLTRLPNNLNIRHYKIGLLVDCQWNIDSYGILAVISASLSDIYQFPPTPAATAADAQELRRLIALGTTPYVDSFLRAELAKLAEQFPEAAAAPPVKPAARSSAPKVTYESITSYAFSDSNDKASIIIREIKDLASADIQFQPTEHGFTVTIHRQGLSNLKLSIAPTYKKIIPGSSKYTVKGETLTIALEKKKKTSWSKLKKGALDTKKPKIAEPGSKSKDDPNTALMDMMKKMYDEGDDEMKRTISKAMWEAHNKKGEDK